MSGPYKDDPHSEVAPLLPQHRKHVKQPKIVTGHQASLDKKLHSYILFKALLSGSLPSTAQTVILLRKLLASDVLARHNQNLTTDGRKFVDVQRKLISDTIDLLQDKNGEDQIQNFLWMMRKARLDVDVSGLSNAVVDANAANAKAAYSSLGTIGTLLLNNQDFNKLFSDVTVMFRQALASGASTAAHYTEVVAGEIEPSKEQLNAVAKPAEGELVDVREDTKGTIQEIGETVAEGAKQAGQDALETLQEEATPERKQAMKQRVRDAVVNLRRNADYNSSVSTVSLLLKNYLTAYSTALQDAASEVSADVEPNKPLRRAGSIFWSFITSFGDEEEWRRLKESWEVLLAHKDNDPEFENIISVGVESLQKLMTDPDYLFQKSEDHNNEFSALQEKIKEMGGSDALKKDLDKVLIQAQQVYGSIRDDKKLINVKNDIFSVASLIYPSSEKGLNQALVADVTHVLGPLILQSLQYIPIPRFTMVSPDLDLLLEPLILEPGKTVNSSSFFPYNVGIVTTNEVNLYKGRSRTSTIMSSTAQLKIQGISIHSQDIGYIMKLHKNWFLSMKDSGIASFSIDEKGMDIFLDLEFTRSSLEQMVILKGVTVKIHKLNYTLSRSKFSFLAWIMKPFLKPILRKLLEKSIASALEDALRTVNTEMVFFRERLRATRIANPDDLTTFIKAIISRWQPPESDVDVAVDWRAHRADGRAVLPFDGEYAPGSLASLLESEGVHAQDRVEEGDLEGWRSECFEI